MKFTLPEIKKKQYQDTTFTTTLDVSAYAEEDPEILAIAPVKVTGRFHIEAATRYHFDLHIETTLSLACAITLDPVEVPLIIDVTETFCEGAVDEDCRSIEGITIDLLPIVWSNIYLEKPLRVTKPEASFERHSEPDEDAPTINPAFAALKKFKE
ncbi:MAG: hypothetical protein EA374_06075 [Acholeplasmatales bacterium]|nr:MAG: hypothetical protein EA374_06075 [Acholeplasmatales bacterium]